MGSIALLNFAPDFHDTRSLGNQRLLWIGKGSTVFNEASINRAGYPDSKVFATIHAYLRDNSSLTSREHLIALARRKQKMLSQNNGVAHSPYNLEIVAHTQISNFIRFLKRSDVTKVLIAHPPHIGYDYSLIRACIILNIECYFLEYNSFFMEAFRAYKVKRDNSFELLMPNDKTSVTILADRISAIYTRFKLRTHDYIKPRSTVEKVIGNIKMHTGVLLNRRGANIAKLINSKPSSINKYAIFFLHYQPEQTTSYDGGSFCDQLLAISNFVHIAKKHKLVPLIKEHPVKSFSQCRGALFKQTLNDILRKAGGVYISKDLVIDIDLPRVGLVGTISGTVGVEAALCGTPVLVYGQCWYGGMTNTITVSECENSDIVIYPDEYSAMSLQDFSFFIKNLSKQWHAGTIYHNSSNWRAKGTISASEQCNFLSFVEQLIEDPQMNSSSTNL